MRVLIGLLLGCWLVGNACAAESVEFTVYSGSFDRVDCPVWFEIPDLLREARSLELRDLETMDSVAVQRDGDQVAVFFLTGPMPKDSQRRFRLSSHTDSSKPESTVSCIVDQGTATFGVGNQRVLTYWLQPAEPPEGLDSHLRRSGHIHPVWTPGGRIVTDQFAPGDAHKHGIYSAWVNTEFQGRKVDFWNQWKHQGTVEHRRLLGTTDGPVFGSLSAELAYLDLSAPDAPRDALYEQWMIRVFAVKRGHLFEIESRQRCAGDDPLILLQHNYGGMALRGPYAWQDQAESDFLTSEGKNRIEGNYTRPNWVNMHGLVDGALCGLTVFSHPSNFRWPQMVRLHPELTYFVFTPVRLGEFRISPGETYVSRFRYFADDGPADAVKFEAVWNNYAHPPTVEWPK